MPSGTQDYISPISLAAQTLASAAISIAAQTLPTVKMDYRYGTATFSEALSTNPNTPINLLSITGKGIIFSGRWSIENDTQTKIVNQEYYFSYILDGDNHDFPSLVDINNQHLDDPAIYSATMQYWDQDDNINAGFLPGPITFEDSFALQFTADPTTSMVLSASILYAIALD